MTRRVLLLLAATAGLGWAAFFAGSQVRARGCGETAPCHTEMEWLKREYALDDAAFARVCALHEAYKPPCEDLCRRVAGNRRRIDELAGRMDGYSNELDAALREAAELRFEAQRLYLKHVYAVEACMSPEQGRRYAAMMNSRVFDPCGCKGGMCLH